MITDAIVTANLKDVAETAEQQIEKIGKYMNDFKKDTKLSEQRKKIS